jgi:hypothetical protein
MFSYEKITITRTRVRISLGGIAAVVLLILVVSHHKTASSDLSTLVKMLAIVVGTAVVLGAIAASFYIHSYRKAARTPLIHERNPVEYHPAYVINSQPVAEIEGRHVYIDGEEYVKVIRPNKLETNAQYGKGRQNNV